MLRDLLQSSAGKNAVGLGVGRDGVAALAGRGGSKPALGTLGTVPTRACKLVGRHFDFNTISIALIIHASRLT